LIDLAEREHSVHKHEQEEGQKEREKERSRLPTEHRSQHGAQSQDPELKSRTGRLTDRTTQVPPNVLILYRLQILI